jgi:hypothetical protein
MRATALCGLLAATAVAIALPADAAEPEARSCELPAAGADPLTDRAGILAQYERLPRACLDEIFATCTAAASRSLLDPGSAAVCSFGYEALLRQGFGGNFRALLAWWRSQRNESLQ